MSANEAGSLLDKWRNKTGARFIPMQASLELTNRCNERCTHCYIPEFKDDPARKLSRDQWFHLLDELRAAGTLYLILMGGEAMLNPYFYDIATRAKKLGFHLSMISNGLKINNKFVALKLKNAGMDIISFSLYSLEDKIHDRMTQVGGSLKKTLAAIRFCRESGIKVTINTLLTSENIAGYFDLAEWCMQNQLEMKTDPTVTPKLNGNMDPTRYRATEAQLRWYYAELVKRWPKGLPKEFSTNAEDYICNAAKGKCAITAYGELLPCIEIREPLGNLLTHSFKDIWFGKTAAKWRDMKLGQVTGLDGAPQAYCEHCPGMAQHEHADAYKVIEHSRLLAKIRQEVVNEYSPTGETFSV